MAGSHTLMPGIIYTNAVLNVLNNTSGIPIVANMNNASSIGIPIVANMNNASSIGIPMNSNTANGVIALNGHSNSIISSSNIIRSANKIIIQGSTANCISNNIQSGHTIINSVAPNIQDSSNDSLINNLIGDTNGQKVETPDVEEVKIEDDDIEEIVQEEEQVIDIMINNVVCSFSVGCHLDLRNIALTGHNVEFRKENGMVTLKLRRPMCTASVWSSGKITCTGSTSEEQARIAARRVARSLQKLGYNVRFRNYRVVNVLGTCTMPFAIRISPFSQNHRKAACYEPELHPGVTFRIATPKATLKIFSTGSITVTAPCVANVQSAIETIYPLVKEFGKQRSPEELTEIRKNQKRKAMEYEVVDDDHDDPDGKAA